MSNILQFKVMSYMHNPAEDDINDYLLGIYDTKDVADRVCNQYNFMWTNSPFYAVVEPNN